MRTPRPPPGPRPGAPPAPPGEGAAPHGAWGGPSTPAWSTDGAAPADGGPPTPRGPRYQPGGLLGEGGMGRVRVAFDTALGRDVALKELRPEAPPAAAGRLAREAWITARLDHPGIVAVHDTGILPDGRPFYTMRLIRGRTLASAIAAGSTLGARLGLLRALLSAAEAVAFAHAAGVVHRDLKPENILLGPFGETQVADWGLAAPHGPARALWEAEAPGGAGPPEGPVGTPGYQSPSQAAGAPAHPTDDVWSLGVVLACVVAGAPATPRGPPPLPAEVPPALAAIAARACHSQAAARYPDAAAFADDLLAWLDGRRVAAHQYRPAELLGRLVRAWRVPLGVGLAGLLTAAAVLVTGLLRTAEQRDRAVRAESAAAAAAEARTQLAAARVEQALVALRAGDRAAAETAAATALDIGEDPRARGIFAAFGRTGRPRAAAVGPAPACAAAVFDPTGDTLYCAQASALAAHPATGGPAAWSTPVAVQDLAALPTAVLVRGPSGATTAHAPPGAPPPAVPPDAPPWSPLRGPSAWPASAAGPAYPPPPPATPPCPGQVAAVAPHPAGFALACRDGRLAIGDPARPRVVQTPFAGDDEIATLAALPDGALLLGTLRGALHQLEPGAGARRGGAQTTLGTLRSITVAPGGRWVALTGVRGGTGLWDAARAAWLGELPTGPDRPVAFRGPAGPLRVALPDHILDWSLDGLDRPTRFDLGAGVADLDARSADGLLVAALGDGRVVWLDLPTGVPRATATASPTVSKVAALAPDGRVAWSSRGGALLAWLRPDAPPVPLPGARALRRALVGPDGALLGADYGRSLFRWAPDGTAPELLREDGPFADLEADPTGTHLALATATGAVWAGPIAGPWSPLPLPAGQGAVALSAGGARIAAATATDVTVADAAGRVLLATTAPDAGIRDLALSADGRRVFAGGLDGRVRVWEVDTGALVAELAGHTDRVSTLWLDPAGEVLATGSWDHTVRLWHLPALDTPRDALHAAVRAAWAPPTR